MASEDLVSCIAMLGSAFSVLLFASPTFNFGRIYERRSVQGFSFYPYFFMLVNCVVWVFYGSKHPGGHPVAVVNGVGGLFSAIWVGMYIWFSVGMERMIALGVLFSGVLAASLLAGLGFGRVVPGLQADELFGNAGAVTAGLMYVGPTKDVWRAWKNQTNASLSLLIIGCSLANSTVWAVYGCLPYDPFIVLPNGFGVLAAGIQLAVYFKYNNPQQPPN